ncbi:hypothetical protein ALP75_204832 [Pseudomonas syringae pv. actinidiae]|nr:hypothetical protein ALP75_204832 [Pseudomonas syringae pv. actinidiae]
MLHLRQFIMIAGKPARRCSDPRAYPAKRLIRLDAAILGYIPTGHDQINLRLLDQHLLDDFFQTVAGAHTQQRPVRLGEQMAVG